MAITFNIKEKFLIAGISLIGLSSFNFYIFDPFYYPFLRYTLILVGFLPIVLLINPQKISTLTILFFCYILFYNYSGFLTHLFDQGLPDLIIKGLIFAIFFVYIENILSKSLLIRSLDIIFSFFVIINVVSLIIFILFVIKVPVSVENINLGNRGYLYNIYLNLLIVCRYVTWDFGTIIISRFNGVFEEPGMLGTYAGILLMADSILFPNKRFRKFCLILFGILSLSVAFYTFLLLVFLYHISFKKLLFATILVFFAIFSLVKFLPKESLDYINLLTIDRLTVKEGKLSGNTRDNDQKKFARYLEKSSSSLILLGNGKDRNQEKAAQYSSIYGIIYQSGFIGLFLFISIYIYYLIYVPVKYFQYKYLLLTIIPIISVYQGRAEMDFLTLLYFFGFQSYFQKISKPDNSE